MNLTIITGNIGNTPKVNKTFTSAKPVLNLSVAVDDQIITGDGDDRHREERTDWIPVVIWGNLAEHCGRHLHKGDKITVTGQNRTRQHRCKDGTTIILMELHARAVEFSNQRRASLPESLEILQHMATEKGLDSTTLIELQKSLLDSPDREIKNAA